MAGGWQVLLESELSGVECAGGGGVALLYQQRHIDELARRLGVAPLSRFFSRAPDEIADYLAQQGLDPAKFELPEEAWFEADDGLNTVHSLLDALRSDSSSVPQHERVMRDLEEVEQALRLAALHNVRFHLSRTLSVPHE